MAEAEVEVGDPVEVVGDPVVEVEVEVEVEAGDPVVEAEAGDPVVEAEAEAGDL